MPNPTKSKPADGNEMTQIVTRARVRQFRKRQLFTMREFAYALGYHLHCCIFADFCMRMVRC